MKKENYSIRWHSRAGQGAITAANFLAENAFQLGFIANSFPDFGAEKRGAAVKVFNKISKISRDFVEDVSQPDIIDGVILFDKTLATAELGYDEIITGLAEDGFLLVNARQNHRSEHWGNFRGKIFHIDGSGIAKKTIGRDIPNVTIVGALTKILNMDFEKSRENLREHLSEFFTTKVVEMNLVSFEQGFNNVKEV
jgi:pyruvate ferredoxin oxidoreductase gamma subunit